MNLSPRDRRAIIGGGIALLLMVAFHYGVTPVAHRWREARQQIATAQAQLIDMQMRMQRARLQHDRLQQVFGPKALETLPSADEVHATFVHAAQKALAGGGLTVQSMQLQPVRPIRDVAGTVQVALQIDATCRTQQLINCLAKLPEADRFIFIERMNIATNESRPGELRVSLVLATVAAAPVQEVALAP